MRNQNKQPKPEPGPDNIIPTQNIDPTMQSLPDYHGAVAPKEPCVRRRWRRKDQKPATAAADAVQDSSVRVVDKAGMRQSAQDQDPYFNNSFESGLGMFSASMPSIGFTSHVQSQKEERGYRRVDSLFGSESTVTNPSSSSSSESAGKPTLPATSTSAEIVEALMPDRPIRSTRPRRTASVRKSY